LNHAGYLPGIIFPAQIRGIGIVGKDVLIAANKAAGREAIAAAGRQNDVVVIDDATFSPDDSHAGKVLVFTNGSGCALSIPLPTAADRQTGAASTKAIVWTAVAPGPEGNQIGIYTEGNNPSGETDVEEVAGSIKIRKSNRARISIDAGDMAVSGTPQVVPILLFDGEVDGMPSYSSGVGGWTAVYDSGDDELDLISPSGDKWSIPVGGLFAYPDQIPDHSQWVPVTTNATGAPSGITALTSSAGQVKDAADAASLTLVTASLVGDGSGSFDDLDPAVLLTGGEGTSSGFNFKIVPRGGDVTLSVDAAEDLNGVTGGSGVISQGFKELRFLTQAEGDHMVFGDIGAIS
jgi:hypothetical protein